MEPIFKGVLFTLGGIAAIYYMYMILSEKERIIRKTDNERANYVFNLMAVFDDIDYDQARDYSKRLNYYELKEANRQLKQILAKDAMEKELQQ